MSWPCKGCPSTWDRDRTWLCPYPSPAQTLHRMKQEHPGHEQGSASLCRQTPKAGVPWGRRWLCQGPSPALLTYLGVVIEQQVVSPLEARAIVGPVALIPLHHHGLVGRGGAARPADLHHGAHVALAVVLAAPFPVHTTDYPHPDLHAGMGVQLHGSALQTLQLLLHGGLGDGRERRQRWRRGGQHGQHTWKNNRNLGGATPCSTFIPSPQE